MNIQRKNTSFRVKESIPTAELQQTPFLDFFHAVQPDSEYEKSVWELATILFDQQDCEAYGIPKHQSERHGSRLRKERFITFWQNHCRGDAEQSAIKSADAEKAVALLSANEKVEACEALAQGKNYRLATLVAQIGGNAEVQGEIASQIQAWRDLNVLSEMSEPIRAIYSLLAGETCICEGKRAQHVEDKASTFPISKRFDLDWKRAFGLKLYYAIKTDDPLEEAVAAFASDIKEREQAKPGEDVMYSLLQLYAASKFSQPIPPLENILLPQKTAPSAMTARLSFQLYFALTSFFATSTNNAAADTATKLFAAQLDAAGEWLWALFALIHNNDAQDRQQQIQSLLSAHARDIHADPPHDSNSTWRTLIEEFKIPEPWIWEAKALYARTRDCDRVREANYLVKAGHWLEAHNVLKRVVGPECVVAEEWAQLQGLIEAFKPGKTKIDDWSLGGQVYLDYLSIVMEYVKGKEEVKVLERLLEGLRTLIRDAEKQGLQHGESEKERFLQKVALQEMREVVGREIEILKEKVSHIALRERERERERVAY